MNETLTAGVYITDTGDRESEEVVQPYFRQLVGRKAAARNEYRAEPGAFQLYIGTNKKCNLHIKINLY